MDIGGLLSSVETTAVSVLGGAGGKLLVQAVGGRVATQFGGIVANEAGVLVQELLGGAQGKMDAFEAAHPRVVAAVANIRAAAEGVVAIPTEEQVFHALSYSVGAILQALQPAGATATSVPATSGEAAAQAGGNA